MSHTKQGQDVHEVEYFDDAAFARIIQELSPPFFDPDTEVPIANLMRSLHNRRTLYFAQKLLGVPELTRQTPTNTISRPMPCVPRDQQSHILRLATELTVLRRQPPNPEAVRDAIQRASGPYVRAKASRRAAAKPVQDSVATPQQAAARLAMIDPIAAQPAIETLKLPQATRRTRQRSTKRQTPQRAALPPKPNQATPPPKPEPESPPVSHIYTTANWPDATDLGRQLTKLFGTTITKADIREAAMGALDSDQKPTYDMRDDRVRVFSPAEAAAITIALAME